MNNCTNDKNTVVSSSIIVSFTYNSKDKERAAQRLLFP